MVGDAFKLFTYFLFFSLHANYALARASNITFSDPPTTCSPVTISWQGGTAPFTVIVLQVDMLAKPGPDGTIPGIPVQVVPVGSARRVVWTATVEAGQTLVAVVRDGVEQNASSDTTVVQASSDVTCLAAVVCQFGLTSPGAVVTKTNRHQQALPTCLPLFFHP
jgi:hypothetical protein